MGKSKGWAGALLCMMVWTSLPASPSGTAPITASHPSSQTRVLVRLRDGLTQSDVAEIRRQYGASRVHALARLTARQRPLARWHRLEFARPQSRERLFDKLKRDNRIEYLEPDYELSVDQMPDDPRFADLWGLHNSGQVSQLTSRAGYTDADIDAPEAWDVATGASDITVAVIDTGVEYDHSDLAANMWLNPGEIPGNGIDDDGNGYVDDVHGYDFANLDSDPRDDHFHGTHVAGTIAATGNNGIGVVGVSWHSKIMALKAQGENGGGFVSDAVMAVDYAVANGARIINASFGGYSYSQAFYDAISAANDANVLFVAAAGNDNNDNDLQQHYPSGYELPNIISVAASDRFDARAAFSNFGRSSVDIGAPGAEILSTGLNGGYALAHGTSMAAPHVAGAAAVVLGHFPSLATSGIKALIENHGDSLPSMAGITTSGARLNLWRALTCDETALLDADLTSPASEFTSYWGESNQIQLFVSRCGTHVPDATVELTFDNGEAPLTLFDDGAHGDGIAGDGLYGNRWFPQQLGPVSITATASHATLGTVSDVRTGKVWHRVTYRHEAVPFSWIDASAGVSHLLDDDGSVTLPIGFDFPFFGVAKSSVTVSANGFITFGNQGVAGGENERMPSPALPNDLVAVLWDDLDPSLGGNVHTLLDGVAPNRRFTVAWVNVQRKGGSLPVSFQATLMESTGEIIVGYSSVDFGNSLFDKGASASVGVESADGLDGTPYVFNQPLLGAETAHRFYPATALPEISYQVDIDLSRVRSTAGSLTLDFIDGDGVNNNHFKILEFTTEGELVLSPDLLGDASGTLLPGPARLGDAQFMNGITQPMIYGNTLSFLLNTSPAGEFRPFPDTLSMYLMDANGTPYASEDPLGLNQLLSVEIDRPQPVPESYVSEYATVSIEIVGLPTADAGGPYEAHVNEPVQFDGTASFDPEGAALTYRWSFGDGTTATGPMPAHTFAAGGTYPVSLTVSDGLLNSAPSETTVTVASNYPPDADAGIDRTVYGVEEVSLDGSASSDADGTIVAYLWEQVAGPSVLIAGDDTSLATFVSPDVEGPTQLTFRLTVTDDVSATGVDYVDVSVLNEYADEDADGLPDKWELASFGTLEFDAGDDPDGDGLSNLQEYEQGLDPASAEPPPAYAPTPSAELGDGQVTLVWSDVVGASRYDLYWSTEPGVETNSENRLANVTSPYLHTGLANGTAHHYVLVAANNIGESPGSAEVQATPGLPPTSNPGGPYTALAGEAIVFDGTESTDPEGHQLTYAWTFGDGGSAAGSTPSHTYVSAGVYTVTLEVNDGDMSSEPVSSTATVLANHPPTADAGPDQVVSEGAQVLLDGSGSHDQNGSIVAYAWTREAGPNVPLEDVATATASFTAPQVSGDTVMRFRLTVTDDFGDQASDTVEVLVLDYDTDSDADGLPDGWEYRYFDDLSQGPTDDPDGDGFDNFREFEEGTSPVEPAPVPARPVLSAIPGDTETLLHWDTIPQTLGYDLYWSTTPGVSPVDGNHIENVGSPYLHTSQTNGMAYYYVLIATNNAGQSPPSAEAFSVPQPRQWTEENITPAGSAIGVQAATGANGDAMKVWLASDGIAQSMWARRYTRAGGWEPAVLLEDSSQPVSEARVAVDGKGNAFAVWLQWDGTRNNLHAARYVVGLGWQPPVLLETYNGRYVSEVGDVSTPVIKMNRDGAAVVSWLQEEVRWNTQDPSSGGIRDTAYANYYTPGQGWGGRVRIVPFQIGGDRDLSVDIDGDGNAVAVWRHWHYELGVEEYYEVYSNRYSVETRGWSAFSVIGPNTAGDTYCRCGPDNPIVSVARDGTAVIGYEDSGITLKQYTPASGWAVIDNPDNFREAPNRFDITATDGGHLIAYWARVNRKGSELLVRPFSPDSGWLQETRIYEGPYSAMHDGAYRYLEVKPLADGVGRPAVVWLDPERFTYAHARVENGVWNSVDIVAGVSELAAGGSYSGDIIAAWSDDGGVKTKHFHVPHQSTVPPLAPVADAGPDQTVAGGDSVTLDGTDSADPDGTIVNYLWTQTSGSAVALTGGNTAAPTFFAPAVKKAEMLSFELTVTDDTGMQSSDKVSITVNK